MKSACPRVKVDTRDKMIPLPAVPCMEIFWGLVTRLFNGEHPSTVQLGGALTDS
jgi:hypothetical protein